MDTKKFEVFIRTAQLGNVTRAAEQLGYTQSAASHSISCLENAFGFDLFARRSSGMELTELGKQMYPMICEAVQACKRVSDFADDVNGLKAGSICVGSFTSVASQWMPALIKGFTKLYPNITIEIFDGNYSDVETWIAGGIVDCGFVVSPTRNDFEIRPVTTERMLAVMPEGHALCAYQTVPLQALMQDEFIVPAEGTAYDVGRIMRSAGISMNRSINFVSDFSVISMVRASLGISVLPELILKGIALEGIATRPLEELGTRTICTAVTSMRDMSPACRRFLQFVWKQKQDGAFVE